MVEYIITIFFILLLLFSFIKYFTKLSIIEGAYNICIGNDSGTDIVNSDGNICIGDESGGNINTGNGNIAIGCTAGSLVTSGDYNISIGEASIVQPIFNNQIAIGTGAQTLSANECVIGDGDIVRIRPMSTALCDLV